MVVMGVQCCPLSHYQHFTVTTFALLDPGSQRALLYPLVPTSQKQVSLLSAPLLLSGDTWSPNPSSPQRANADKGPQMGLDLPECCGGQ